MEMSNKTEIKIDPDEIKDVLEGISSGQIIQLRQGFINPSFIVTIKEDEQRMARLIEAQERARKHNDHDVNYNGGGDQKKVPDLTKLKDIFAGIDLLGTSKDIKSLGSGQ